jgi:hypothetical protein
MVAYIVEVPLSHLDHGLHSLNEEVQLFSLGKSYKSVFESLQIDGKQPIIFVAS